MRGERFRPLPKTSQRLGVLFTTESTEDTENDNFQSNDVPVSLLYQRVLCGSAFLGRQRLGRAT
jgi:hypothetical protein